jgi:hypothetical protein
VLYYLKAGNAPHKLKQGVYFMKKSKLPLFLIGLLVIVGCPNPVTEEGGDITITSHPTGRKYVLSNTTDSTIVPLSVTATSEGTMTYQWYSNTANSNRNGKVIDGATDSTYKPPILTLDAGDYYYYVVITNIAGSVTSRVAKITIVYFEITAHPTSREYVTGSPIAPLTVKLSEDDTSKLTFQWYSNTLFSNKNGTSLGAAANGPSYTPAPTGNGDFYYYVNVSFGDRYSVDSMPALIRISATATDAPTQFTIGDTRLNYVRGVGGTGSFMFRIGNRADASPDADVDYIDKLFGELGCNILRVMVQDDYLNYIQNTVQGRNSATFYHNARDNFFPVIRRANEYGGYVFANPWTAPASMKTPASLAGGYLTQNPGNYVDYAEHLRGFMQWLNDNDAPIFCLGILNEPDYGMNADYEGMGMNGGTTRDWFRTVGHFTTQKVKFRDDAGPTTSQYEIDVIPGYGGGGPTHHVLTMSGDTMGDVPTYMNPQINPNPVSDAVTSPTTGSNNRIEVIGRHYYASASRYTPVAGPGPSTTSIGTAWKDRPQLNNYIGPYEAESLAMSRQMYAPGAAAGSIKREIWQTEHDFNYASASVTPPASNPQNYWNSAFAAMNDVEWCLRMTGESVFCWWFSSSYSGLVTSYQTAGFGPHTITPRGRAFAHFARYVNETWLLDIARTRGTIDFNATRYNVNQIPTNTNFDAGSTIPKISAFEDVDGKFISIVMFAPSNSTYGPNGGSIDSAFGTGGTFGNDDPTAGSTNVGRIQVVLPEGFTAAGITAIRSYGHSAADGKSWDDVPNGSPRYWIDEPAILSADGKSVEVTLKGGNIISIMVKGEWTGAQATGRHFETRVRPYTVN